MLNLQRKYSFAWDAKRDKSVENQKISCVNENIGFANKCAVLCYIWVQNCVRITYGEVNILVEKLTIYFYRLKLAAQRHRL